MRLKHVSHQDLGRVEKRSTAGRRLGLALLGVVVAATGSLSAAVAPASAYDFVFPIVLSAAAPYQLPGGGTTLTATDPAGDVSVYTAIEIRDADNNHLLRSCPAVATCSVDVNYGRSAGPHPYPFTHHYVASNTGWGAFAPSGTVDVTWTMPLVLNGVVQGNATNLTAAVNYDLTYAPYDYLEIRTTTGQLLASCGDGYSCSVTVPCNFSGVGYVAYIWNEFEGVDTATSNIVPGPSCLR